MRKEPLSQEKSRLNVFPNNKPMILNRRRFLLTTLSGLLTWSLGPMMGASWGFAKKTTPLQGCVYLFANWSPTVKQQLAKRKIRLQHLLYHALRNSWHFLSDTQRTAIRSLGWAPPRPSRFYQEWLSHPEQRQTPGPWAIHNGSGEDFLYMHREMIAMTNQFLQKEGKDPVASWSKEDSLPAPDGELCADEKVPPAWEVRSSSGRPISGFTTRLREVKSSSYFYSRMLWWEQQFRDYRYLKTLTLGELGSRMEMSIHNDMHLRWSSESHLRDESDIDPRWDAPGYDTLLDEYSSHVNPLFWRLHSWIDNRIHDWAEAHGTDVQPTILPNGLPWFKPGPWVEVSDPWTGPIGFVMAASSADSDEDVSTMEKVVRILAGKVEDAPSAFLGDGMQPQASRMITLRDL